MPYGEKTKEQLIEYSSKAFEFFESKNVKAVVMACNTTSAVVYEDLKDKYQFKLYPLIQSVSKVFGDMQVKSLGVFATPATINSHAYSKWINKYNPNIKVTEISCPEWVKIVENNETETGGGCEKSNRPLFLSRVWMYGSLAHCFFHPFPNLRADPVRF